ncbi:MAG: hypothetical protein RR993_00535 [Clostridia bacterium]
MISTRDLTLQKQKVAREWKISQININSQLPLQKQNISSRVENITQRALGAIKKKKLIQL